MVYSPAKIKTMQFRNFLLKIICQPSLHQPLQSWTEKLGLEMEAGVVLGEVAAPLSLFFSLIISKPPPQPRPRSEGGSLNLRGQVRTIDIESGGGPRQF